MSRDNGDWRGLAEVKCQPPIGLSVVRPRLDKKVCLERDKFGKFQTFQEVLGRFKLFWEAVLWCSSFLEVTHYFSSQSIFLNKSKSKLQGSTSWGGLGCSVSKSSSVPGWLSSVLQARIPVLPGYDGYLTQSNSVVCIHFCWLPCIASRYIQ